MNFRNLRLLYATDFSPNSKKALKFIRILHNIYTLDLYWVHAVPSFWKNFLASGAYQKEAYQRLLAWQTEFLTEPQPSKISVNVGNPADVVIEMALKKKAHLIIVGDKNKIEGRYKAGTTLEGIVRSAKQSVLVAKKTTVKRILCAIDGTGRSAKALKWGIELSKKLSAELSVIFAIPNVDLVALGLKKAERIRLEQQHEKRLQQKIDTFLTRFDLTGVESQVFMKWGYPADVILDNAEDLSADLIVIAAQGQSRLKHLMMGSVAEKLLRFTTCSLLVVR